MWENRQKKSFFIRIDLNHDKMERSFFFQEFWFSGTEPGSSHCGVIHLLLAVKLIYLLWQEYLLWDSSL